ncbi:hypothetical protein D3874_09970 [Oleomonas cavernae]|uniref:Uncharacterized protein n=2 Tax=Oleomonas cavernae TaxID=2320859 RepID=A0A418WB88_9PROT|nr:hypothetical protein D3874_09970 [Oleomonas cavernae]
MAGGAASWAAGSGPQGRYVLDVDATYQAFEAAGAATPQTRKTLEQQKGLMVIVFQGESASFVTGPLLGNKTSGQCDWRLDAADLKFERCRQPDGSPFSVSGAVRFEAAANSLTIQGNAPGPLTYRPD